MKEVHLSQKVSYLKGTYEINRAHSLAEGVEAVRGAPMSV